MDAAYSEFLSATTESATAAQVIVAILKESLQNPIASARYSEGSRNSIVRALAADVEQRIGSPADIFFRTPGEAHNSLQSLLDAYLDVVDAAAAAAT